MSDSAMAVDDKQPAEANDDVQEEGGEYWNVQEGQKRQRKTTERTVVEGAKEKKENTRIGAKGQGTELADMPRVCELLNKYESKARELKLVHRVLFGVDGVVTVRKRNI